MCPRGSQPCKAQTSLPSFETSLKVETLHVVCLAIVNAR